MNRRLDIKVCGMRDAANIRDVEALGIDMMGFIFYPLSPRYVDSVPGYLPSDCSRVGVFVNAGADEISQKVGLFGLDAVQLHGMESPMFCRDLRNALNDNVRIIKALSVKDADTLAVARSYEGVADMLLFDTPCADFGGSGRTFDWSLIESYCSDTPFMLSGGIGPDSLQAILAINHPQLTGVDINSRFELAPALKDIATLSLFIDGLRSEQDS